MLAFLLATLENNEAKQIFIKIYEQHRPLMERTATRILKEPSDIEDAVQNAFVQIIRHFDKIYEIPREELPFWIISIVKNEARLIIRKHRPPDRWCRTVHPATSRTQLLQSRSSLWQRRCRCVRHQSGRCIERNKIITC